MSIIEVATPEDSDYTGLPYKFLRGADPAGPIAYLVHGRAGNVDNMWAFRRCIPDGWTIVTPQAPLADAIGGWSWWRVPRESTFEDEVATSVSLLANFIDRFEDRYQHNPSIRIACGFSQGAAILSSLIQREPKRLAALALLAGFVLPLKGVRALHPSPKVFIAHGVKDEIVTVEESRRGQALLESLGVHVERVEDEVGHKVGVSGMRKLREWCNLLDSRGNIPIP